MSMSNDQKAEHSRRIVTGFAGEDPGDVINILVVALGMAVCMCARSKDDAMDMINCIMLDYERDVPKRYDEVQKHIANVKARPQL